MILKLGERLKALRKNKDMTQEELAEYLGVTYQAVSRWERGEGYPDISTLPLIAEFFKTTTDDLLGVNQEKSQQKIKEYLACGAEYFNKKDFSSCTNVLREALSEFPNSDEVICALAKVLFFNYSYGNTNKDVNTKDEIISLGKRVLSYSSNDILRVKAKSILFSLYMHNQNDFDKAKEIADSMPRFDYEQTFIPAISICDIDEKQKVFQQMIMDHAHVLIGATRCYIGSDDKLTPAMKINIYERCNMMYEILFNDEYDYDMLLSNNFTLAKLHMELGEHDKAMAALIRCGEFAINWNRVKELPHTETYKTPLLNRLSKHVKAVDAFEKNETRDIDFCAILLSELDCDNEVFAPLHDNDNYKKLVSRMNA